MILVDTSVLINFLRGEKTCQSLKFEAILKQKIPFGITSQIFQELLQGTKTDEEYNLLKRYLETQTFFHTRDSIQSFAQAAKIYFKGRKNGITIRSSIDCLIAQIAIENDLFLLHDDEDFIKIAKIVNLKLYEKST